MMSESEQPSQINLREMQRTSPEITFAFVTGAVRVGSIVSVRSVLCLLDDAEEMERANR